MGLHGLLQGSFEVIFFLGKPQITIDKKCIYKSGIASIRYITELGWFNQYTGWAVDWCTG
jgi:hypothetical protein